MKSTNYDPNKEDKEADYVPITNKASSNLLDENTWEEDPRVVDKHRKAFYLKAFPPPNPDKEFVKSQSKSASIPQCRPQTELDHIKYVVENWQVGTEIRTMQNGPDKTALLDFRRTHPTGNKYIHQYHVDEIWAPGDPAPCTVLRRLERNKDTQLLDPGRIVLSREEVFDGIREWHHSQGHMGQERTWGFCKEKFWNVTQQHVRYFCTTCFECMRKNPVIKKHKGSIKPIFSKNFRDRFQVYLIDFRRLRKRDPFGVLMRWVMTLKDHATGLTFICALPRKQAHLVAYKLQEIFGMIGYPKIFHTDNGKEFTAKCVLELLRNFNPNIISVTGRPRRPSDQGSIENVNKLVKRIIGSIISERRMAGYNPNWTEILGSVAAVVNSQNSQYGRGKNDVSAYEAVYGQVFDHPLCCTKEEARRCWSVKDRMLVTIEPEFDIYIQENYDLEDDINEVDFEDYDDTGYFSGDDLPIDEMNEVTDEWFESRLMDGCHIDDTPSDTPSTTSVSHSKNNKKEHTKKNDIESPMSDRKPPPEGINEVDFEDYDDDGYFTGDDLPVDEREAARYVSSVGGQGIVSCNCRSDCTKQSCSCKKAKRLCSSRCHRNNNKCKNKHDDDVDCGK
jgi:hypothetical protein